MKTLLFTILISLSGISTLTTMAQTETGRGSSDTLCILWTSGDPDVALKMVFMYASNAAKNKWWDHVELIIWGPSARLTAENPEIGEAVRRMSVSGIKTEACKACADMYGVSDKLNSLGVDVKYMGQPLTRILKSDKKLMTF
jgi:hypothetical protein